jgi:hypothetical protein
MISSQCFNCGWLLDSEDISTCYAYTPGPIPEEIITGEVGHTEERGDEIRPGILYTPIMPDTPEA